MGESHYIASTGVASASFLPELPVVATLPCAITPVITPTYANQVPQGNVSQVVMELGTPEAITAALAGRELYAAKGKTVQLEARIEELHKAAGPVWDNRALPFLAYIEHRGKMNKSSQVAAARIRGGTYTRQDLAQLMGRFLNSFPQNLTGGLARDEIKSRLMKYVANGEFDELFLEVLKGVDKRGFEALPAYLALANELKEVAQSEAAVSELEEAVRRYKASNDWPETLTFLGRELNLAQAIEGIIGVKPARHFLLTIDRLVEGEVKAGLVSPLQFKPNGKGDNIPEELKLQYRYLPVERLGQIMTLFDAAIRDALEHYKEQNQELKSLFDLAFSSVGRQHNYSVLMRAAFPDGHKPTLALYPDWRLQIGDPELKAKIIGLVRSNFADVSKAAANYFGVPEEQFNFQRFIALQAQLMQFLPMSLYACAAITSAFSRPMEEARKRLPGYTPEGRARILTFFLYQSQLQRDFGITLKNVLAVTDATREEALRLFNEEEAGFIRLGKVSRV